MREGHEELLSSGGQIVAVVPDDAAGIAKHLKSNTYPFSFVADPDGKVFEAYDVTSRMLSLGQQPALFIVGTDGLVKFDAIGKQQWDLVSPKDIAKELAKL